MRPYIVIKYIKHKYPYLLLIKNKKIDIKYETIDFNPKLYNYNVIYNKNIYEYEYPKLKVSYENQYESRDF